MVRFLFSLMLVALLAAAGTDAWAQPRREDGRLTPEQREQWRQMTPEQKGEAWRRLPPEQRQAIRQQLTPEQREAIRDRMQERRENGEAPGRRLSPEERRQLRDQIRESNRARPPRPEKNGR